jgi:hypothetical protein
MQGPGEHSKEIRGNDGTHIGGRLDPSPVSRRSARDGRSILFSNEAVETPGILADRGRRGGPVSKATSIGCPENIRQFFEILNIGQM